MSNRPDDPQVRKGKSRKTTAPVASPLKNPLLKDFHASLWNKNDNRGDGWSDFFTEGN